MSFIVWSIEMSLTNMELGPSFLVQFILKFKISMALTLYKLSLKLLSAVADPEFSKRGVWNLMLFSLYSASWQKKKSLVAKGGRTPCTTPEVLMHYFI